MSRYLQTHGIIRRQLRRPFRPIATFGLLQALRAINAAGFALDRVLYQGLAGTRIDRPVFILGNPRSGTTFLHKHLESTGALAGFELWEMLFPSIAVRRLLAPFVDRLAPLSPARYHASEAHETSLRDLETDDVLELLRFFDGGFLWAYFLAWEDLWGSDECRALFEPGPYLDRSAGRLFPYLESCWRRNMRAKGRDRIVAKSSMLTLRVEQLVARYPDCRIVYAVRDPRETIPSGMSLLTGVLDRAYGAGERASAEARARYNENLYAASCHLYRTFHEARRAGVVPEDRVMVVPFPRMMTDLERVTSELLDFLEVEPSAEFASRLAAKAERQRGWKSSHAYGLEKYGLDEDRIRNDLAFVFGEYDVVPAGAVA